MMAPFYALKNTTNHFSKLAYVAKMNIGGRALHGVVEFCSPFFSTHILSYP